MRVRLFPVKFLFCCLLFSAALNNKTANAQDDLINARDSLEKAADTSGFMADIPDRNHRDLADSHTLLTRIPLSGLKKTPFTTVQQYLKGTGSGLYVREESGEPGTEQFMYIRGVTTPMLTKQDLYNIQPVVYVNGIPLSQDNGLTYNIQRYDFNRIGSAVNPLAGLDVHNIEQIEVLKTPEDLAKLGPIAANGAIWITTKRPKAGFRQFNFQTYFGTLQRPGAYPVNAEYEHQFRTPYYDRYATIDQKQNMAVYVGNVNDPDYYGPSNWTEVYFRSKPVYYVGGGLQGGTDRANFMFNISNAKDQGFDATRMDRYSLLFGINVLPAKWLTIVASINASRIERQRNRSLRERFAETGFVPYLSNPLSPGKDAYLDFLEKYRGSVDENKNNSVFANFSAIASFGRFEMRSLLSVDYQESMRDAFFGKPLMDNNSFLSTYFGVNQRVAIQNAVSYNFEFHEKRSRIDVEAGQSFISDVNRYDYVIGYNTPNDFIKVKEIALDPSTNLYENVNDIFAYPFTDVWRSSLSSLYGMIGYSYKHLFNAHFVGRYDGYSGFAPGSRWLFTPVVSARLNIEELLEDTQVFSTLSLRGSWGLFGKLLQDHRFKMGPQYRVDLGYGDAPLLGSYAGFSGLSQSYSAGRFSSFYNWPFARKLNVGMDIGLKNDRYMVGIDFYRNEDRNMIVPVDVPAENGFSHKFVQQMAVENSGINLTAFFTILKDPQQLNWNAFGNFSWNRNKLIKLPYGLNSIIYGNRKIAIGKPVDSYWLYENQGIINTVDDIPQGKLNPDGSYAPLTFNGILNFSPGDALWSDVNRDGTVDNKDKVLKGNFHPDITGGLGSAFGYRNFSLEFQFYYALGHQLLNRQTADKLDFINAENSRDITYIKEVTFWQKTFEYQNYPLYNPWSRTIPYRLDQDLFLENADFVKLRSLSLGYDFANSNFEKLKQFSRFLLYISGSNLFTFTSFKGGDPEQYDYQGLFSGKPVPIPRSYIIGLKLNF